MSYTILVVYLVFWQGAKNIKPSKPLKLVGGTVYRNL